MHEQSFAPLLIVVGAAVVTGVLLPRLQVLRIPLVVGEILIGIALGVSGVGLIPEEPDPWLELLSLFGFAFLMFLSGLEIDLRALSVGPPGGRAATGKGEDASGLRRLLVLTFSMFGATLVVSLLLSQALVMLGYLESPYIMALIMSTTSVGLVMPLLKERGEGEGTYGQTLILAAVVADFATMLLITVVVTFYEHGRATVDALVIGTLFILFFGVLWIGKRLLRREATLVRRLAFTAPRTAELPVRAAMTLMLGFVVFSQVIGTEIILGAFLAGTAIRSLSRKSVHGLLGMKLDAIGFGFFIPIFFIMVGARFDLRSLVQDRAGLALVPLLIVFAFAVKVVPSLLLSRFFGRRNAIAGGFLLSSRLSLVIAASAIGLRLGVITPQINSAIILVAILTCVISPAIYSRLRGDDVDDEEDPRPVPLDQLLGSAMARSPRGGPDLQLQLVQVHAEHFPFLVGQTLAEAQLRGRTGLTLIAVSQADGTIVDNPGADLRVGPGDALVLIGTEAQVRQMEDLGKGG